MAPPRKKTARRKPRRRKLTIKRRLAFFIIKLGLCLCLLLTGMLVLYTLYVSGQVQERFAGRRWSIPSKVFSDTTLLYPGQPVTAAFLKNKLKDLEYHVVRQFPDTPGQCVFENGILINRMNRTQVSAWHLSGEMPPVPDDPAFTDVSDATVFLALFGKHIFSLTEKLTSLDFLDPSRKTPFLLQGPFSHVPCQIVTLKKNSSKSGILMTFSRGYARDMVAAILSAGEEFDLRPAGEQAFTAWLAELAF